LTPQQGGGVEMERANKEIVLPTTKYTVQLYEYYLRGDRVAIERIMTDAVDMTGEGKIAKVDTGYKYRMEDEAVKRAIKSIKDGDKVLPIELKTIHDLPEDDYEFIRASLPKESEKKSTTRPSGDTSEKRQKKEE